MIYDEKQKKEDYKSLSLQEDIPYLRSRPDLIITRDPDTGAYSFSDVKSKLKIAIKNKKKKEDLDEFDKLPLEEKIKQMDFEKMNS